MKIIIDDLSDPRVVSFLNEHLEHMIRVTPAGCVHALDIEALKKPEITFWTGWNNHELLCCGAIKKLDQHAAELKSMRTAPAHLGKGLASQLLYHILREARKSAIKKIYLETGSYAEFEPARKLYEKFGFEYSHPFADYSDSPNSVYMALSL